MSLKIGSLFCGGGVGESRLNELGCKTIVANEIREDRCTFQVFIPMQNVIWQHH